MQDYLETKGLPNIKDDNMVIFKQFHEKMQARSTRALSPVKLEIRRNHLARLDDFIALACDDVYNWIVEDSKSNRRKSR